MGSILLIIEKNSKLFVLLNLCWTWVPWIVLPYLKEVLCLLLTFVRLWVIFWDYGGTVGVSRLEKKKNLILSVCKFSKFHLFFSIFWFPGQFFTKNKMHIYPHFQNSSYLWSEEAGHCQTNKKLSWFNFFLDRTHVWI